MNIKFDIFVILNMLGGLQGLVLAIVLWNYSAGNIRANRILAIFILNFVLVIAGSTLFYSNYIFHVPFFVRLHSPFALLLGPVFYFYLRSLLERDFQFKKNDTWHLLPFLLTFLYLLPIFIQSVPEKRLYLNSLYSSISMERKIIGLTLLSQSCVYMFFSLRKIQQFTENMQQSSSKELAYQVVWMNRLIYTLIATTCLAILRYVFGFSYNTSHIIPLIFSIIIYTIGYFGLKQPDIFSKNWVEFLPKEKQDEENSLADELLEMVQEKHYYLIKNLSIQDLSKCVKIPAYQISKMINEQLGKNFYDFINELRVEEAKRRLLHTDYQNYTVESIGLDSGFNSKSTFNAIFKKFTGMTPTQFKKQKTI